MFKQIKDTVHDTLVGRFSRLDRMGVSAFYIRGKGIEIGALNLPLFHTRKAQVTYVDRISAEEHQAIFPDMDPRNMVHVDIIDDAEHLSTIPAETQDFVIANHFLEHCANPVGTIKNLLRVIREGGILFLAIPDKRFTFDSSRALTTNEHFKKDFLEGPAWSEEEHYFDFVRNTEWSKDCHNDADIARVVQHLKDTNFSIHYHVWSHQTMIEFFTMMIGELQFNLEIELALAPTPGGNESLFVLRKIRA